MNIITQTPNSWVEVPLREVCNSTKQWNPQREPREEFWYIDVSAVSRESCTIREPQRVKGRGAPSRARKIVQAGDSIFATVRPTLRRVAFVDEEFDKQIASTAFCVVRPNREKVSPRFLYYLLRTDFLNEEIAKFESGASYPAVNDKDVLDRIIPLPPKREQEKIAAVLWKVQRAIEVEEKLIATAVELKQSAMRQLLTRGLRGEPQKDTDVGPLPESWQVRSLSEIAKLERGRFLHRPRNEPRFYGGATPFVQTGDVVRSRGWIRAFTQTLNKDGVAISRVFPKGTILITIAANIGFTGVLDFDSACPDSLVAITPDESVDTWYLEYFLQSQQAEMDRLAAKGTQKNINIQFLSPWPVAVPSIDEQGAIAEILQTVDRKIDIHQRKREALQELFKTLLHRLMSGAPRVTDLDIDTSEVVIQ
jgi:type I restriction enzyme S subunit